MMALADIVRQSSSALQAYRLRAALTMLGMTMGVATIITVMTLIQGANTYVEEKVANLGTNVFQVSRVPLAVTDFNVILKALKNKHLTLDDAAAITERCRHCLHVGARSSTTVSSRYENRELTDTTLTGHTAAMANVDTRTVETGRYFTQAEDQRASAVCVIGTKIREELFVGQDPLGRTLKLGSLEFTVIGVYEKVGAVLGQDQDNFAVIPMSVFRKLRGSNFSPVFEITATAGAGDLERAQDEVRLVLRARRQVPPGEDDNFYFGTAASYIALWQSISAAFFAVFILVSGISGVVGGIVIMNVMLVAVTQRTKEIGVRRAVGATKADISRQFLSESLILCLIGGTFGILGGFALAMLLRVVTSFPAAVAPWVAGLGFALSTMIGLFFGIYPASRAAALDPVTALRAE